MKSATAYTKLYNGIQTIIIHGESKSKNECDSESKGEFKNDCECESECASECENEGVIAYESDNK